MGISEQAINAMSEKIGGLIEAVSNLGDKIEKTNEVLVKTSEKNSTALSETNVALTKTNDRLIVNEEKQKADGDKIDRLQKRQDTMVKWTFRTLWATLASSIGAIFKFGF